MARPEQISRYLPVTFPNGIKVRRFGKHCPHCHAMVGAESMLGSAHLLQDRLYLHAEATCRHCHTHFPIACVITPDKHVHRVLLPAWLFRLWLKLATRHQPQPVLHDEWEETDNTPAHKGVIVEDSSQVTLSDDILGRFQDLPINAWVEYQGQRFVFERAMPPSGQWPLSESQLLLAGRLIYQQEKDPLDHASAS